MPSKYQSKVRVFLILGLALVCLELFSLIVLTPWIKRAPSDVSTVATAPVSSSPSVETKDTKGEWLVVKELALPSVTIKQSCRGIYQEFKNTDNQIDVYCLSDFTLTAVSASGTQVSEIVTLQRPEDSQGLSLLSVKQLGEGADSNARLLFQVQGMNDCENDLTGCGFNYTVKLVDLGTAVGATHFTNSFVVSADPNYWNRDYTKGFSFLGICEGGCIPESVYGWNTKDGKILTLTSEEAYLSQQHYDERVPDLKEDVYKHWGNIKWVDDTHIEAELIDQNGNVTRLRKEVK